MRWHRANDKGYDWNITNHPQHDPRPMTEAEVKQAAFDMLRYGALKLGKIKD